MPPVTSPLCVKNAMSDLERSNVEFESTRWSLVDALRDGDQDKRDRALHELSQIYWPAIYSFLRRKGHNRDQASEVTQAFFGDVVLHRKLFANADADRARLRNLVLVALRNYCTDRHRRAEVRNENAMFSLDRIEMEDRLQNGANDDPENAFHRRWASGVLEESLRRCEQHCRDEGKERHWEAFSARVLQPTLHGVQPPRSADVAAQLGFDSEAAVNNAVFGVKARQQMYLKQIATETTSGNGTADDEYRDLLSILM